MKVQNHTTITFSDTVKKLQEHYGSRSKYEMYEQNANQNVFMGNEIQFIQSRDSFYLSTIGASGWPYVQFRGGPPGFIKVIDPKTFIFGDVAGNKQYISSGNIKDNKKASIIMMDYPKKMRLKIWAESEMHLAADAPNLLKQLESANNAGKIERIFVFRLKAFEWNCPKLIPQKFTLEQIANNPELMDKVFQLMRIKNERT